MNTNIYINNELYKMLVSYSEKHHISRSALIREALEEWFYAHSNSSWKKGFFDFEPLSSFPSKEELRMGLIEPKDDPLA